VDGDNTGFLWDTASGKKLQTFQEHADRVRGVALSADGKSLAVAGAGVSLWNLADGKKVRTLRGKKSHFQTVALSGNGKHIVAGSREEEAILWDATTGNPLRTFPGFDGYFSPRVCVAITADARRVVVLGLGSAHLWDAARADQLETVHHPNRKEAAQAWARHYQYNAFAVSRDGKRFVLNEIDKAASLWDLANGKRLQTFGEHAGPVRSVALSGDDRVVLTGSLDRTAILWDAATGKKLQTFAGHTWPVTSVALSADGKLAVTVSNTKVTVWDATTGVKLRVLEGKGAFADMTLAADGKRLWTTAGDRSVRLWNLTTGKERCRIYSLNMGEDWLVVTPDGRFDGSRGAWRFVDYRDPDTRRILDDDETRRRFHRPGLLAQAWKGVLR
jgi:WD40 repeat protein